MIWGKNEKFVLVLFTQNIHRVSLIQQIKPEKVIIRENIQYTPTCYIEFKKSLAFLRWREGLQDCEFYSTQTISSFLLFRSLSLLPHPVGLSQRKTWRGENLKPCWFLFEIDLLIVRKNNYVCLRTGCYVLYQAETY